MLLADDEKNVGCLAWETNKRQGPFHCPECNGEVILKKGIIREHHFAHRPPFTCQYGSGESQLHYQAKRELYLNFFRHDLCSEVQIERKFHGVRPDLFLLINKIPVAIEIQRSSIPIDEIFRKAEMYDWFGINLLYLFPNYRPDIKFHYKENKYYCRPNQWEQFIHSMYFGKVYYWQRGLNVSAYHFSEFQTYVEPTFWYEHGEEQTGGDYYRTAKVMKTPNECPIGDLNLVNAFEAKKRMQKNLTKWVVPSCKIWIDKHGPWW